MAIFHLSVKCLSRSVGHSAVAAAAYRAGTVLRDKRTGIYHDYSRKRGVIFNRLLVPACAPKWNRNEFWDHAESAEKRKNSTVARECLVALPHELAQTEQIELSHRFASWLTDRYSIGVDCSIHSPGGMNDSRNAHAHLLLSTRVIGPDGFSQKTRVLDVAITGSLEILEWRNRWAEMANEALEFHQFCERIDSRSHIARRIIAVPTVKVGRHRWSQAQRERNREIRRLNRELSDAIAARRVLLKVSPPGANLPNSAFLRSRHSRPK